MLAKYRIVAIANSLLMLFLLAAEIITIQLELDNIGKYIIGFSLVIPSIFINFYTGYLLIKERRLKNEKVNTRSHIN